MKDLRISVEKQRAWKKAELDNLTNLGVEGFTITDLPFSTVLQAYLFLAGAILNIFLERSLWWQDTDTYFFYKNTIGKKNRSDFLNVFWKLHTRLLDHHVTFEEIKHTPNAIVSVAANGRRINTLRNRITQIAEKRILGIFIVSGGGILQLLFKNVFPFNTFLNSSSSLLLFTRNKYPNLQIFAASNPNLKSENLARLLQKSKNINVLLTQPPFLWSRFQEYLESVSKDENIKNIEMRVGVPIFTNPWNVRFWMQLVGVKWRQEPEAAALVRLFEEKYNQDTTDKKTDFKEFSKNWSLEFIKKIDNLRIKFPQITGIHLMPMGNSISIEEIIKNVQQKNLETQSLAREDGRSEDFGETSFFAKHLGVSRIEYKNIKYKNHFYELDTDRVNSKTYLDEEFVEQSKSKIWDWNHMFWEHIDQFMSAQNKSYHKSIGGSADSNYNLAKYSAQKFFNKFKNEGALSAPMNYLEMGAAGTEWAKMFLLEILNLGGMQNLQYVFTDYSQKALDLAKQELREDYLGFKIIYIHLDKNSAKVFFENYKNKISQIHATNIYDNFPMDPILFQNNKIYKVLVKAYLETVNKNVLQNYWQNYTNWQKLWNELKFEEKYLEIDVTTNQELFKFYQKLNPKNLELEMNVSSEVTKNISRNLELLKTGGVLEIVDIVAVDLERYKEFLGPVKYDGSVANYVNWLEIKNFLEEKNVPYKYEIQSLDKFGGRKNQSILEIKK